jgi:osmoprotectant transport system permease protein
VWTIGRRDARHHRRRDQPRQPDLCRAADAELGPGAGRLHRRAALALAADAVLALVERGLAQRRPALAWMGLGLAAAALAWASLGGASERRETVIVGAKNFSEQYILARLIGRRLEGAGLAPAIARAWARRWRSRRSRAAISMRTSNTREPCGPARWRAATIRRPPAMRAEIARWLEQRGRARLVGALGFENAYAFAVRPDSGLATLDDLARASPRLTLGSDLEFLERPEWARVQAAYPVRFAAAKSYSPTFMYRALASGDADVITAFSSDGRIAADKLTVLTDGRRAIPNYDALLLVSARCAAEPRCLDALKPLVGRIPVTAMREANYRVDRDTDKQSPAAAAAWLEDRLR